MTEDEYQDWRDRHEEVQYQELRWGLLTFLCALVAIPLAVFGQAVGALIFVALALISRFVVWSYRRDHRRIDAERHGELEGGNE